MTPGEPRRFLHVANGTCTTSLIAAAGIPGARSIWADPLYEGPVPGRIDDAELLAVRARYLSGASEGAAANPANDLRHWRAVIERHDAYDELILWFEHDLFDQLNLIQLLTWIRARLPRETAVSLICIASFPGHPRFKGLGELSPDELASLLETRTRVSDAQYALADRAWEAFRQATPASLDALRDGDTTALPHLAPAIARFLQEYPWTRDGLTRTERRLLELSDAGIELSAAFPRMHEGEDVYYVTDLSLAGLAESLAGTSPPLLTREPAADAAPLRTTVRLTEEGREVLSGRRDRLALGSVDRWLGGVHLRPGANHWRWDETTARVIAMDGPASARGPA